MKKCPYCGKEYADDVLRCAIDGELLPGLETQEPASAPTSGAVSLPLPFNSAPTSWTERELLIAEVVVICLVAFGGSILSSLYHFSHGEIGSSPKDPYNSTYGFVRQGAVLAVLWYVLTRRGKSFADLGLAWSVKDFGWSILLRIAGDLVYLGVRQGIRYSGLIASHKALGTHASHFSDFGIFFIPILIGELVNPFFEELLVRAYLMTMVRQLTGSVTKAIVLSTILQASYHLYQGGPAALAHGATFLIWSIYYAKTKRIAPIILAHLYNDVGFTLLSMFRF